MPDAWYGFELIQNVATVIEADRADPCDMICVGQLFVFKFMVKAPRIAETFKFLSRDDLDRTAFNVLFAIKGAAHKS